MGTEIWIAIAALAGLAIGWIVGRAAVKPGDPTRSERAERELKDETARGQERLAAAEKQAQQQVAAVQAEMASRIERLKAEHRAETEKLSRHLTEVYDELDKMRVRVSAGGPRQGPDTGQGFPATMPMGDL